MNMQCTCTRISYSLFVDIGESKRLYFAMKVLLACVSGPLPVKFLRIFNFFWLLGRGSPKISYVFCLHLGGGKYCDPFYAFFFLVCLMSEDNEMNAENGSSVLMV